jgi:hypothetical protein
MTKNNVLQNSITRMLGGKKEMKHKHSKIGEYGIRWERVEGYTTKDGKKIPPHYKKVEFKWKQHN